MDPTLTPPEGEARLDLASLRHSCGQCSLQQLCLPAGADAVDVERLDRLVQRRTHLQRGEALYRIGDPLGAVYVPRSGAFKTIALNEEGERLVIGFHLPGELIGLDALGGGSHRCEAVALESAHVCAIQLDELEAVVRELPALQRQLLRVIGHSVGRDQSHFEMLWRRQAVDRVAFFLHGLSERYRVLARNEREFQLPMSREDIGSYLGLVIETVSRSFGKLQDDGIIQVRGRQLRILDPGRLRELAHVAG
jgi:CRP/FNR family transcriptional regulator